MSNFYQELSSILNARRDHIQKLWLSSIFTNQPEMEDIMEEKEAGEKLDIILELFLTALISGGDSEAISYESTKSSLKELSKELTLRNMSPSNTARFVFSLKDAVFEVLQDSYSVEELSSIMLKINRLIDSLGLVTFESYVEAREELILEQQKALEETSTPVVKVWEKVLLTPLVGMLDSSRTQFMMERMLSAIEEFQAKVAIIDISGIPIVDSMVARHLIMTAQATRLMGAECIITGINSEISQTIVRLGIDLTGIITRTSLADGLVTAFSIADVELEKGRNNNVGCNYS